MRLHHGLACALAAGWAAAAQAQPAPPSAEAQEPRRLAAQLRLNGSFFDNFFQASDGLPEEDVLSGGLEGSLAARLDPSRRVELYGHAGYERYRDFGPSTTLGLGLRSEDRSSAFDLGAQYHRGRPSRDVGDVVDPANDVGLAAEYSYRVLDDLQLTALADARREWYERAPQKRNDVFNAGAAARYRGWTRFSPEIGFRWGRREVQDVNEDLDQHEWFVRLRWTPASAVYVSLRYRRRQREYTVDDPLRSNFGREDRREQWTIGGDIRLSRHWSWGAYLAREASDSTRPSGVFTTQMATVSLALRY